MGFENRLVNNVARFFFAMKIRAKSTADFALIDGKLKIQSPPPPLIFFKTTFWEVDSKALIE